MQSRYTSLFLGVICALTLMALASYHEISASAFGLSAGAPREFENDSLVPLQRAAVANFADVYAADAAWRAANAREYSLAELRKRGDGRRSAREAMQDRVFSAQRAGQRGRAIGELERWVARNPRDADALLSLARLLNESGRKSESVARYRQALAVAR